MFRDEQRVSGRQDRVGEQIVALLRHCADRLDRVLRSHEKLPDVLEQRGGAHQPAVRLQESHEACGAEAVRAKAHPERSCTTCRPQHCLSRWVVSSVQWCSSGTPILFKKECWVFCLKNLHLDNRELVVPVLRGLSSVNPSLSNVRFYDDLSQRWTFRVWDCGLWMWHSDLIKATQVVAIKAAAGELQFLKFRWFYLKASFLFIFFRKRRLWKIDWSQTLYEQHSSGEDVVYNMWVSNSSHFAHLFANCVCGVHVLKNQLISSFSFSYPPPLPNKNNTHTQTLFLHSCSIYLVLHSNMVITDVLVTGVERPLQREFIATLAWQFDEYGHGHLHRRALTSSRQPAIHPNTTAKSSRKESFGHGRLCSKS